MSCCPGLRCSLPDLYFADSPPSFKPQLKVTSLNTFPGHPIYSWYITICILYYHHLIFFMYLKKKFFPLSRQLGTGMIRPIQYIGSFLFLKKTKKQKKTKPWFCSGINSSPVQPWASGKADPLSSNFRNDWYDWLTKISYTLLVASSEMSQGDKRQGRKLWKAPAFFSLWAGMKKQVAPPHLWEQQALGWSQHGVCRIERESLMT